MAKDRINRDELADKLVERAAEAEDPLRSGCATRVGTNGECGTRAGGCGIVFWSWKPANGTAKRAGAISANGFRGSYPASGPVKPFRE